MRTFTYPLGNVKKPHVGKNGCETVRACPAPHRTTCGQYFPGTLNSSNLRNQCLGFPVEDGGFLFSSDSHIEYFISKVKNPAVDLGYGSRSRVQRTFWSQQRTRSNEWIILLHFYSPYFYSYLILVIIVHARLLSHVWLCDPMDCSPPSSSVHGVLQVRILEWVAISCSRGSSWPRDGTGVSCVSCIVMRILYCCATWEAQWII